MTVLALLALVALIAATLSIAAALVNRNWHSALGWFCAACWALITLLGELA